MLRHRAKRTTILTPLRKTQLIDSRFDDMVKHSKMSHFINGNIQQYANEIVDQNLTPLL